MPSKRELIDTGTDKRYVRRDEKGQFKESDDVGRSLSQDTRRKAKTTVKSGQGDRGDQKKGWAASMVDVERRPPVVDAMCVGKDVRVERDKHHLS